MKNIINLLSLVFISCLFLLSSCSNDNQSNSILAGSDTISAAMIANAGSRSMKDMDETQAQSIVCYEVVYTGNLNVIIEDKYDTFGTILEAFEFELSDHASHETFNTVLLTTTATIDDQLRLGKDISMCGGILMVTVKDLGTKKEALMS